MQKLSVFVCSLYFLAFTSYSLAMSADQKAKIHEAFEKLGMECIKDHQISSDDVANLRSRKIPTGPNAPCFLACIMKKVGVMDDQGMVQKENALEKAKEVFNDPEELKNIEDYLHSCAHINSEAVSDGAKGCERSMLAYKCMSENASKFGFEV